VNVNDSVTQMLSQLAQKMAAPKAAYLQWIQASIGQDLRMIPVEDILFFRSDEKYTCVQTERFEALIRKPVRDLAEELDPALFWQIHRATLVNVNAIEGVTRDIRGRHLVLIKGKPDKLEVSRSFLHLFKQM
jgi:DNA-binding LytR/AlgR family response regulator